MKNEFLSAYIVVLLCGFSFTVQDAKSQILDHIYTTDISIDPEKKGSLLIELDNVSFFKNNEFQGDFLRGYSLPGFWLKPTVIYYPLKDIKLEAGVHGIRFWGAEKYPNFAYSDIASWKGKEFQRTFHVVPIFRVQFAFTKNLNVAIGSIYSAGNHGLITPLYNPELNLLADPENGVQIIYNTKFVNIDTWINWESFIFELDDHQEAFTVGFSSKFNYNNPTSKLHFYSPVQVVGQHRGGEIDDCPDQVQMLFNATAGFATVWNTGYQSFSKFEAGVNALSYYQQKGCMTPFNKGYGLHAHASLDISKFRLKTAYWMSKDFATLFGSPFYGNVSMSKSDTYFDHSKMIYLGAEYFKSFGKGYSIGADIDIYRHLPTNITTPDGISRRNAATSFAIGVYFRVNPSFLLKKF